MTISLVLPAPTRQSTGSDNGSRSRLLRMVLLILVLASTGARTSTAHGFTRGGETPFSALALTGEPRVSPLIR